MVVSTSIIILLVRGIWTNESKNLIAVLDRIASSVFAVIYPGFFLAFGVRMTTWSEASYVFLFFLCLVFTNDTVAYVFGKLLGKKLGLVISPKKSVVGFIAGLVGSIGMAFLFFRLTPWLFDNSILWILLFGLSIGVTAILGDLVESALKRSAGVKDSGIIMMGRGGMMDSLDSIVLSVPLFYFLFPLIQ